MNSIREIQIMDREKRFLLYLNRSIYQQPRTKAYRMTHIELAQRYILLLNHKLGHPVSDRLLNFVALSHDLLKEAGLNPKGETPIWHGHPIPQDPKAYVRLNLDALEPYGLDRYFNTDIQYHALASGLFLILELEITQPEVIYPVCFHACPIIPIYETLTPEIQTMVDLMMLADKLSSNWLKINALEKKVKLDLDLLCFGPTRKEFNYTEALYAARFLGQGSSTGKEGLESLDYYWKRAQARNPLLGKITKRGMGKIWPKRQNPLWSLDGTNLKI